MPIYDMYPYTNLHELNLDWIIKVAKETQDALTDINTLVSDLSDLYDCLHARPDLSPPRLVCDYDFYVSGNIDATSHNLKCSGINCTLIYASADIYANDFHGSLDGNASTASYASSAGNLNNLSIGSSTGPIYLANGVPMACGTSLGVSVTGSSASAGKLSAAKTFELTGPITGSVSTDLDSGMSIATTQNIIKKVSMQSSSWSTQATTPLAGATVTATAAITNIDWIPGTFDPDSVVFLGAIVTSYEEQSLTFYPVGLYYQSDFQEMVMTVGVDGMFAITDMDDAIFDVYYINKLT